MVVVDLFEQRKIGITFSIILIISTTYTQSPALSTPEDLYDS